MRTDRTARFVAALLLTAGILGGIAGCSQPGQAPGASTTIARDVAPSSTGGAQGAGAPLLGAAPEASKTGASASPASAAATDRMVIRNANVRLEVAKVQASVARIRALAKANGAVISNLQLSSDTGGGSPEPAIGASDRALTSGLPFTASVTVLVPIAKYDAFRNEAEKLGKVLSETSADDDVTQQHADLKARLTNARAEEVRLRTFFDKARTVNDMLAIERELARVRADIESMTAQLTTMERQAAMATLTMELVEPQPIVRPSNGIDWGFADALTTGIQAMTGLLRGIIVIAVATAPLWMAAIALALIVRWRLRVRKTRREAAPERDSA